MIERLRFYNSNSFDPYENLSIEKHLLDTVPADCLILYLWQNQNTVVIGRNQNPWAECRCAELESEGGRLARRLSGGGAVFHDIGNLNFTFLCSTENYDLEKQMKVIQTACSLAGIETELSGRNDILADGRKFSGNAFYNSKGKSYHHGTILISADREKMSRYLTPPKAKLEAKGVRSVRSRIVNLSELCPTLTVDAMKQFMLKAFEDVYGTSATEHAEIDQNEVSLFARQYGSWDWLYGTPLPFTVAFEGQLPWGHIELQLQVKGGIIENIRVFTDSMDHSIAKVTEDALRGHRFDVTEIREALSPLPSQLREDIAGIIHI